jgi:hypothetical protein
MKPLVLFDPEPRKNDYLTRYVFPAMKEYGADTGRPVKQIDNHTGIKNSTILLEAQYLSPQVIIKLKMDNNFIVSFDINDNTCLCNSYFQRWEAAHIDLVFKYAGILNQTQTTELDINGNFDYSAKPVIAWHNYWAEWTIYDQLKKENKFVPCAYTPWDTKKPPKNEFVPFEKRRKTCLIRGGLHYLRYHLFLMLLKHGLADQNSMFDMQPYHLEQMRADMRFCPNCCKAYLSPEGLTWDYYKNNKHICNQRNKSWQGSPVRKDMVNTSNLHLWNNECLPSYYWLTERWIDAHGGIDITAVEKALNGKLVAVPEFERQLQECLFYGDYKWLNCINFPMRHWHSAREKTITLVPRRTNDQYYFPRAVDGDHYITFADDFSDLHTALNITKAQYTHITENCFTQYMKWINSDKYTLSTNMLKRMFDSIEAGQCIDDEF